mgnify:CR=1 FL=1
MDRPMTESDLRMAAVYGSMVAMLTLNRAAQRLIMTEDAAREIVKEASKLAAVSEVAMQSILGTARAEGVPESAAGLRLVPPAGEG